MLPRTQILTAYYVLTLRFMYLSLCFMYTTTIALHYLHVFMYNARYHKALLTSIVQSTSDIQVVSFRLEGLALAETYINCSVETVGITTPSPNIRLFSFIAYDNRQLVATPVPRYHCSRDGSPRTSVALPTTSCSLDGTPLSHQHGQDRGRPATTAGLWFAAGKRDGEGRQPHSSVESATFPCVSHHALSFITQRGTLIPCDCKLTAWCDTHGSVLTSHIIFGSYFQVHT